MAVTGPKPLATMNVNSIETELFGEKVYVLWNEDGGNATIIDPGMMNPRDCDRLNGLLESHHLTPEKILLTHFHIDHVAGINWLVEKYHLPVYGCMKDEMLISMLPMQAAFFHLKLDMAIEFTVDHPIVHGDSIEVCSETLRVLETPGHTPGSVSFHGAESKVLFSGDTLFQESIGRTDLPGGNYRQLIESITDHLLTLPPDTIVLPGHGPSTTIANEKRFNPYI